MGVEQRILILAPLGRDAPLSQRVLEEAGLTAAICASIDELCAAIGEGAAAALITEEVLVPGATAQLLATLKRQAAWSDLPILVFGAAAPQLGENANVTLLDRPVRLRTLVSTARAALRARGRQYQTRDLLAALEQSVRDRDQFLAMLGHELRNPLAAILTASELIDRGAGQSFVRERAVIGRQTRNLARLVDDLLEVARVTSGKIALHPTEFDLAELVRRLVLGAEPAARKHGLTLILHPAPSVPIAADALRVEQIVANVLTNAIKYTPAAGRVEVELRSEGPEAVVRVRDTGVGISPEMLPKVFELFTQAPATLDRAQGGMGIGLTLAQRLARLHGGSISARSEGLGKGSEFEVRLPLSRAAAPRPGESVAARGPSRAQRILLVEDNDDFREVIGLALARLGHRVSVCGDGRSAVERALRDPPDAMIVDLGLPGKNGLDVAREVRTALGPGVRLIAMTGYGQPEDRARALRAGFDAFLAKPAEIEDLQRALQPSPEGR